MIQERPPSLLNKRCTIYIWPSLAEVAHIGASAFMQPSTFLNHRAEGENKAKLQK